jgi:hypothetical protein
LISTNPSFSSHPTTGLDRWMWDFSFKPFNNAWWRSALWTDLVPPNLVQAMFYSL